MLCHSGCNQNLSNHIAGGRMRQLLRPEVFRTLTKLVRVGLLLASTWALPQQPNSVTITGNVVDSSGARMPDVQITLRDPAGSVKAKSATDSQGQFLLSGVDPGTYVLQAERKMFETEQREITVSASVHFPDLQIVMKVVGRRETVNVLQPQGYAVAATSVGTKTDVPLLQVPFSIQVVPQEVLQDQQVTRIEQAVSNISNVYQTDTWFGNFADQFVIRGFFNNQVVYRDGFRIDTGYSGKQETAIMEQIEVLKG